MTTPTHTETGNRAVPPARAQPYPPREVPAAPRPVPAPPVGLAVPGLPTPGPLTLWLLARSYRKAQIALGNHIRNGIGSFWAQYIDPAKFADSFKMLKPMLGAMIVTDYNASAANAAAYYQQARVIAGLRFLNVNTQEIDQEYLDRVMNSVSLGSFFHQLKELDPQQSSEIASRALQGASARLVLLGGRDTITNSVATDKDATGWERMIDSDACAFCSMLASRGGVYKKGTVDFRAHDHCNCTAQPVFRGQEPFGVELYSEWQSVTKGKSGASARAAWERHWNEQSIAGAAQEIAQGGPGNGAITDQRIGQPALPDQGAQGAV